MGDAVDRLREIVDAYTYWRQKKLPAPSAQDALVLRLAIERPTRVSGYTRIVDGHVQHVGSYIARRRQGIKGRPAESAVSWSPTMTEAQARTWAANSALKGVYIHTTAPEAARAIKSEGFKIGEHHWGRVWGDGVYMSEDYESGDIYRQVDTPGVEPTDLRVMVNVRNPLLYRSDADLGETAMRVMLQDLGWIDEFRAEAAKQRETSYSDAGSRAFVQVIKNHGYDSLHIIDVTQLLYGEPSLTVGGHQIVVFDPKQVVVLR